ncbi:glutamate racemase [Tunturiibacter gelidoferens]|uniref:Glutamate racemase n=1 Tax=Tunturiibacter gelidiferens TaxID=3069689 RepID=A0A9X0U3U3_9BACT|nr:glutamate racemase [Edaphobacter lichenicola]MBB5328719.1 glutamate racemase [Edaphobacter lichenicola]
MTESPSAQPNTAKSLTIGVFDSGFGGLTVLRALLPLIPDAHYIFLGDTARLPYGSKSRETVARYAVSSAKFLHTQGADLLVIACNTATALALEDIQQALPIPVIGVVEPGAQAALTTSSFPVGPHHVLVLATSATVQSHAYTHALHTLGLEASEKACPLLVPLVEEGWTNHPVTDDVLKIYLTEALAAAPATQTLLLGCTHYPLIEQAIHRTLDAIGHPLTIIDSADAAARATAALVAQQFPDRTSDAKPTCTFYATDSIEKFQRLGSNFLGQPVAEVNLIDLGG